MSLVSIITPTFNNQDTIEETWNSIRYQTHENWEWVVVNDASTDNTKRTLENLQSDKIRIINLETNKGVSVARNEGLASIKGDYFCFLDGDDLLPENSLSARLAVFQTNPEIEFVDGKVISFINTINHQIETFVPAFEGNPLQELLSLSGKVFKGNTWMVKRAEGKSYRFLEGLTHGEELLFYASICNSGKYAFTSEPVLYYRRHVASAMTNVPRLTNGYFKIAKALKNIKHVDQNLISIFKSRAAAVSFKSLLKDLKPFLAIKMALKIKWA
ncbi:glycosyltransferase family 2 protein [Salibacteraceae bacterium]|mgnify:CR=1 FL=1|nr:glycosyltransferase family 2 protein [Salibacteraceae bacterium]MDB9708431.1 glycosyltransferase family 2 protein [Salibacteraceae bacterium]